MGKQRITISDFFLAILALLLIGVSFYQTWLGLDQIFGPSSFVIALVLSLLLLFIIWKLKEAKQNGESTSKFMGIYIFIAIFCFMANFNALYTRFMKTDIYTAELREINDNFNKLESDVNSKFNYSITDEKTRQKISQKTKQLMDQITDDGTPGYGPKAKDLVREIEPLLKGKLTLLTVSKGDYQNLAIRMAQQIYDMMDQLSPSEKTLKTEVENAKLQWNKQIEKLLLMPKKDIDDIAQGEIDKSLQLYNDLVNKSKSILGDDKIKIEPSTSKTQEVGKIGYAFEHAIKNFGVYQFVVLLGCVLLDFIIPIIIVLTTKPNTNEAGSVLGHKRRGKNLI